MWFNDAKWREAAEACLTSLDSFDWILGPAEFQVFSPKIRPIEYSEAPPPGNVAFLCHKDFSDTLSTAFRKTADTPAHYRFANEVFVLGCLVPQSTPVEPNLEQHLASWFNRASGKLPGNRAKPAIHTEFKSETGGTKKGLVVGATSFGNAGDDLLGQAAALTLINADFELVHLAGFDVQRTDLDAYDEVFIGGGGLLYATHVGKVDWQNLANYFKFPFWCAERSKPCHLLSIGHQETGTGIEQDGPTRLFLKESLSRCATITVRDEETASLIRQLGGKAPRVGADLVYSFAEDVERLGEPAPDASGILLVGELFRYPALAAWLQSDKGQALLRNSRVGYALMSNDDVSHQTRLQELFKVVDADLALHDFRGMTAPAIAELIRGYDVLVSTRFHGFVLGTMAGVRPVLFDRRGGKKDRLVRSAYPELTLQLFNLDTSVADVEAVLSVKALPELVRVTPEKVRAHANTVSVHSPQDQTPEPKTSFRLPDKRRKELVEQLLTKDGAIKLCWAQSGKGSNGYANLGDGLSAYMIGNLAGLPVTHTGFDAETVRMFGVGSIGHGAKGGHAVIWGTGCYRPDILINNVSTTTYDVLAVRGNISRECLESVGIKAPECYGEPVWLLPSMFNEKVEKKYELGIISHISDLRTSGPDALLKEEWACFEIPDLLKSSVVAINTWHENSLKGMYDKLRLILSCKRIASRSFHGAVIAEAYGIPCIPICSKPGVPHGAFASDSVKIALLDRRTLEYFNSGKRRPQYFFGQRRGRATDWEELIKTIDSLWTPIGYDPTPMLEAFPFDIPVDPTTNQVPVHPCMASMKF